jgi:high-affinity Fe2+/Pb2+ permease
MASYYFPSGQYKAQALPLIPVVSAGVSTILGMIYAIFISYYPEIYFKLPLIIIWGFLTIVLSRWTIKKGAMRSPLKAAVLVFIGALIGYYVHFAFFLAIVTEGNIVPGVTEHSLGEVLGNFTFEPFRHFLASPGDLLAGIK